MTNRQVLERNLRQGVDEEIAYILETTPWAASPSSDVTITVYDVTYNGREDVTVTVTSGTASVSGDNITLPILLDLEEDHVYRVEVKFIASGNTYEPYFMVKAEL